jgi:hypothetical protein
MLVPIPTLTTAGAPATSRTFITFRTGREAYVGPAPIEHDFEIKDREFVLK